MNNPYPADPEVTVVEFLRCVAEAVAEKGVRGLADMVPGGGYAFEVGKAAWEKYQKRRKEAEQRAEIQQLAQANFEAARDAAVAAVKAAAGGLPQADRTQIEQFLAGVPAAVRQVLKRPDDPSGTTVPASFSLDSPDDVLKLLPPRPPRFGAGDPLPGRPGWVLDRPLGSGGFGEVWLARHPRTKSLVRAVKFCYQEQARGLLHEGGLIDRVMSAGSHQGVVPLVDLDLDGKTPWLMYEYVEGGDLTDWVRGLRRLDRERRVPRAIAALRQLAATVGHFHRLAPVIVHRDLKPSNVLVDRANKRLRVTDFGIGGVVARAALEAEARGTATHLGRLISYLRGSHTPLYASPQQRDGAAPDPRDDVHALGVVGYQMLTGRLDQGAGPDFADDLREAGAEEPLIAVLSRCVTRKADRRPKDAADLAGELEELGPKASTPPAHRTERSASQETRERTAVPARLPSPPVTPAPLTPSPAPSEEWWRSAITHPAAAPQVEPPPSPNLTPPKGLLPFPPIRGGAFNDRVKWRRQDAGHPADGRDLVFVLRHPPGGKPSYHPLFDLPPEVVRGLLDGMYLPEQSRLFIYRSTRSGFQHVELAPAAVGLIDPATGTAPLEAPCLSAATPSGGTHSGPNSRT